jgi:hypothetical protein
MSVEKEPPNTRLQPGTVTDLEIVAISGEPQGTVRDTNARFADPVV